MAFQPLVNSTAPISQRLQEEVALQEQGYNEIAPLPASAYAPPPPVRPAGLGDELYNSLARGFHGLYNNTGRAFSQLAEPYAPEFTKRRIAESLQDDVNYARQHPSTFTNWDQVDKSSPLQIARYGLSSLGEAIPSTLGAVVGGVVGKKLAPLTKLSPYAGTVAGGTAAMTLPEMGEQVATLHNDPYVMQNSTPLGRVANTAGKGLTNAYIETMTEAGMLNPVGKIGKGFLEGAKHVAKTTALAAPSEGFEEYLQDRVGQTAHGMLNPSKEYDPAQGKEAFIRGTFGGGGLGVVGGTGQVLASKFMPDGDFDHSDKIPDHVRKRSLDDQARYLEDTDFRNTLNATHRVQTALADKDLSPEHRKNLEDSLTNVHTPSGQLKAAALVEFGEAGKTAANTAKRAAARFGKMFAYTPKTSPDADYVTPYSVLDANGEKVVATGVRRASEVQEFFTNQYASDIARQDAAAKDLKKLSGDIGANLAEGDINNLSAAMSFASSDRATGTPEVAEKLSTTFSEIRSQLTESQQAKLDKFASTHRIPLGLGTGDIIMEELGKHEAMQDVRVTQSWKRAISDHFTEANNQKNTLDRRLTPEGTTKRMQELQARFDDPNTSDSIREILANHISTEQAAIDNRFESQEFQQTQGFLIKALGEDGYSRLASNLNAHWSKLNDGAVGSYDEEGMEAGQEDDMGHDELAAGMYSNSADELLASMEDAEAKADELGMEEGNLRNGIIKRTLRRNQEKLGVANAAMMDTPTFMADEEGFAPEEFDFATFNAVLLKKGISAKDMELVSEAADEIVNNKGKLVRERPNRSGNVITKFFGVEDVIEQKKNSKIEEEILKRYRESMAEGKSSDEAYKDAYNRAGELTKDKFTYALSDPAKQEEVAKVLKKYGLDIQSLLEFAKKKEMSLRASQINEPHEFAKEDLPYLLVDEGREKLDNGLSSKLAMRMLDEDGNELLINAHNVTSMMAVGNIEASQENASLPYKAQAARNFMTGWAALVTDLNLTPVNADISLPKMIWRPAVIFKEKIAKDGAPGKALVALTPEQYGEYQKSGGLPENVRRIETKLYYPKHMTGAQVPSRGLTLEEVQAYEKTKQVPDDVTWTFHPGMIIKNPMKGRGSPILAAEINRFAGNYFGDYETKDLDSIISTLENEMELLTTRLEDGNMSVEEQETLVKDIRDKQEELDIHRGYAVEARLNEQGPLSDPNALGAQDHMIKKEFFEDPMVGMDGRLNPNMSGERNKVKGGSSFFIAGAPSLTAGIEPAVGIGQKQSVVKNPYTGESEYLDALGKALKKTILEYEAHVKPGIANKVDKMPLLPKGISAINLNGALVDLIDVLGTGVLSKEAIAKREQELAETEQRAAELAARNKAEEEEVDAAAVAARLKARELAASVKAASAPSNSPEETDANAEQTPEEKMEEAAQAARIAFQEKDAARAAALRAKYPDGVPVAALEAAIDEMEVETSRLEARSKADREARSANMEARMKAASEKVAADKAMSKLVQQLKTLVLTEAKKSFYAPRPANVANLTYVTSKKIRAITEKIRGGMEPAEFEALIKDMFGVAPAQAAAPAKTAAATQTAAATTPLDKEGLNMANSLVNIWAAKFGVKIDGLMAKTAQEMGGYRGFHTEVVNKDGTRSSTISIDRDFLVEEMRDRMLSTLAHEFGHALVWQKLGNAPDDIKAGMSAAYQRALAEHQAALKANPNMSFAEHAAAWRSPATQKGMTGSTALFTEKQAAVDAKRGGGYTLSEDEWQAEQFARYVHQKEFRDTLPTGIQKFFHSVFTILKQFFLDIGKTDIGLNFEVPVEYKNFVNSLGGKPSKATTAPNAPESTKNALQDRIDALLPRIQKQIRYYRSINNNLFAGLWEDLEATLSKRRDDEHAADPMFGSSHRSYFPTEEAVSGASKLIDEIESTAAHGKTWAEERIKAGLDEYDAKEWRKQYAADTGRDAKYIDDYIKQLQEIIENVYKAKKAAEQSSSNTAPAPAPAPAKTALGLLVDKYWPSHWKGAKDKEGASVAEDIRTKLYKMTNPQQILSYAVAKQNRLDAGLDAKGNQMGDGLRDVIKQEIADIYTWLKIVQSEEFQKQLHGIQNKPKSKQAPAMVPNPVSVPADIEVTTPTEAAIEETAATDPAAESDPKILAYLQKLLGKNVEVYLKDYADIAGKYQFDEESGKHIITLSKLAGFEGTETQHGELKGLFSYLMGQSYESTAAHEAAHGMYRGMKGTKVYAALSKYALQPHVMAQLKVLLKDSPQALDEARTNMEARLAYVFQFVETGQFLIKQPEVNNWFNRMRAFVRGLFHVLTSDEKAARIFTAMHQGKFANNPKKMYSKLGLLSTIERIEKHSPLLRDINDALFKGFNAQHTRAINSGSLVLKNAADRFWLAPAQRDEIGADFPANTPDFLHARTQTMNQKMNEFVEITDGWGKKELEEQIKKIRRGETPANEREAKLHSEMKTFFKTLFDYMEDSGVKRAVFDKDNGALTWEDMKARKDYRMPQVWDPKKIAEDTAGFVEFAKKTGMSEEAAAGMAERLKKNQFGIDEVQQSLFDVTITPAMTSLNERQIEITPALQDEAEKFLKTDMIEVVSSYVRQAVHRAEFTYRFGNDGEGITKIIDDAKKEGIAKKEDIDQFRLLVKATEGTIGHDISDQMKAINGNMIAYQNWRVLGLSLFTSQIDPLGISVRTGKLADAWKAFTIGWASIFGQLKNQQAYELAARIGIIDQSNTFEGIGNVYSSQYVTGWAKKANDVLFKINGMDAWNNGMRVAATQIGAQWILDNKDNPEILANLGIDASTVDWDLALEKDLTDFFDQEQIANGLFRFVDETILRPNAAQRPAWGSDPHFALVWHLKQFTFTFTEVIIKSALQQAKNGNMTPLYMLASYVPFMMAADFARGLVQGGGEEPEWKKRMSFMDRIQSAIMRSGVSGPYAFAEDAMADSNQGKLPGTSFLGPTANQAMDITSGLAALGNSGDPDTPDRKSTAEKLETIFGNMLPLNNVYRHWDDEAPQTPAGGKV